MKNISASDLNGIVLNVSVYRFPTAVLVKLKEDLCLPNSPKVAFDCAESLRTHFSENVLGSVTLSPWMNN